MRARGFRKKILDISDSFSKREQHIIVKTIEDNYRRPSNRASDNPRLDWDFLAEVLGFSLRKSKIIINEFPDAIRVSVKTYAS